MKFLRQMLADFLRKVIKLDDYIEVNMLNAKEFLGIDELENELTEIDKETSTTTLMTLSVIELT